MVRRSARARMPVKAKLALAAALLLLPGCENGGEHDVRPDDPVWP